ncbi:hypothetical protein EVAR_87908_1 [Eumeta japonica]|uniref:Uncharacterized protein n=1 Tax=Eumeta variegata TaxID=151549 RepID=A0A4C1WXT5_EUMVA|nr:hypothetical protein EVAR_87908_1 [Eumeta japonica]
MPKKNKGTQVLSGTCTCPKLERCDLLPKPIKDNLTKYGKYYARRIGRRCPREIIMCAGTRRERGDVSYWRGVTEDEPSGESITGAAYPCRRGILRWVSPTTLQHRNAGEKEGSGALNLRIASFAGN